MISYHVHRGVVGPRYTFRVEDGRALFHTSYSGDENSLY